MTVGELRLLLNKSKCDNKCKLSITVTDHKDNTYTTDDVDVSINNNDLQVVIFGHEHL